MERIAFAKYLRKNRFIGKIVDFLRENKRTVLTLIFVVILADILFVNKNNDFIIFGVIGLYISCIYLFKLRSKLTFLMCLVLLASMYIHYLFSQVSIPTEKSAVWLVLLLGIGIIQQWKE